MEPGSRVLVQHKAVVKVLRHLRQVDEGQIHKPAHPTTDMEPRAGQEGQGQPLLHSHKWGHRCSRGSRGWTVMECVVQGSHAMARAAGGSQGRDKELKEGPPTAGARPVRDKDDTAAQVEVQRDGAGRHLEEEGAREQRQKHDLPPPPTAQPPHSHHTANGRAQRSSLPQG